MALRIPCLRRSSLHFHAMNIGPPIRRKVITVWLPLFFVLFGLYYFLTTTSTEWQGPVEMTIKPRIVTEPFLDIEESLSSNQTDKTTPLNHTQFVIPAKIHQSWISNEVSHMTSIWIKTFLTLHPDWEYWFWTPAEAKPFLKQYYPDFLSVYESLRDSSQAEDLLRYLVIYHYGGFFIDLDVKCLKPLNAWGAMYNCFVSKEPYEHLLQYSNSTIHTVASGLIACKPGHPFLMEAVKKLSTLAKSNKLAPMNTTGSALLTDVLRSYRLSKPPAGEDVTLIPPKYFMPTFDESNTIVKEALKSKCAQPSPDIKLHTNEKSICKAHRRRMSDNSPGEDAYTNHFWLPLHGDNSKRLYTVSVFSLNPKTKTFRNSASGS